MSFSLEQLASFIEKDKLTIFKKEFRELDEKRFNLLCRKGVFPYNIVDNIEKLNVTSFSSKKQFYNRLSDCHILKEDYDHGKLIWQSFSIKTLGEYSDLYLKNDVILLSDVFENFRTICHEIYGLDPPHYYTLPG